MPVDEDGFKSIAEFVNNEAELTQDSPTDSKKEETSDETEKETVE
jgi:hypothetical protein